MIYEPKPLESHPGFYKIPGYSKHGASRKGEILTIKTGNTTKGGIAGRYHKVSVYKDGAKEPELEYVHVLICKAFYGPRPKGKNALHKTPDRSNNKPSNLYWGTQSENMKATYDQGVRKPTTSKSTETNYLNW